MLCFVSISDLLGLSLSLIKAMATVAAAAAYRAVSLTQLSSPQTSSPHLIHRHGLVDAAGNIFALTFISIYTRFDFSQFSVLFVMQDQILKSFC